MAGRPSALKTELAALRCAVIPPITAELARRVAAPLMDDGACSPRTYLRMETGERAVPLAVLRQFRAWVAETNPTALPAIRKLFPA